MQISFDRFACRIGTAAVGDIHQIQYPCQRQRHAQDDKSGTHIADDDDKCFTDSGNHRRPAGKHKSRDDIRQMRNHGQTDRVFLALSRRQRLHQPADSVEQNPFRNPVDDPCQNDECTRDNRTVCPRIRRQSFFQSMQIFHDHIHLSPPVISKSVIYTRKEDFESTVQERLQTKGKSRLTASGKAIATAMKTVEDDMAMTS